MCLSALSLKGEELKKCRKSTVLKGGLVGYKIVTVNYRIFNLQTPYYDMAISPGWNKDKCKKKLIQNEEASPKFTYPTGIHIYTSRKQADEYNRRYLFSIIVQIHFYPKDVVAEGLQGSQDYCVGGSHSVLVVSKCFVPKEKYDAIIKKEKKICGVK
jgi:hypothetical protein